MRAVTEIQTGAELDDAIARSDGTMRGWQVQGLDLTGREAELWALDPRGALFLGGTISEGLADQLRDGGALVFPGLPDLPFDPWRNRLYTPAELYDGLPDGYGSTPDAVIYAWSREDGHDLSRLLARSLHDSSIDDALREYVEGRRVVGIMGGHALRRGEPAYDDAARLSHELAGRGLTVATGGGPGAMEAANLGARLRDEPADVLDGVLRTIADAPDYTDVTRWARVALDAVRDLPDAGCSLGIPTWHYGHEPPNPFASAVAKYFRNAVREDVLLDVSRAGIVFLPGAAGTVQELFQAACTDYYAPADAVVPLVLVGHDYWTEQLPVWRLVETLAAGRAFATRLRLVDDPAQVVAALLEEG